MFKDTNSILISILFVFCFLVCGSGPKKYLNYKLKNDDSTCASSGSTPSTFSNVSSIQQRPEVGLLF